MADRKLARLTITGGARSHSTRIFLDNQEITHLTQKVTVVCEAGNYNRVILDLISDEILIDVDAVEEDPHG